MQILVVGLGRFGRSVARALSGSGHVVIVVDVSERAIQSVVDDVDQAVEGDATNEAVLRQVGASDVDLAIVAMADVEASVVITTHLKDMKVPRVFAKASSDVHRVILDRVGADHVVFPERDMAGRLAQSIAMPGMLDYLEVLPHVGITEIHNKAFVGHSLANLNLQAKYGVNVLVIKRDTELIVMPELTERVGAEDVLVVIGRDRDIVELQSRIG
jgi:trk system potassium uptake protein TrkA